jgi:NADH dehydrogenase [ubiquinone] 1 alpha subcomplex assembly factor 7
VSPCVLIFCFVPSCNSYLPLNVTDIYTQAFKNHEIVDVFHRPGECDLTTNVDFAFLKEAMGDLGGFSKFFCFLLWFLGSSGWEHFPAGHIACFRIIAFHTRIYTLTDYDNIYPTVRTHGPIAQGAFLERMGLGVRVDALVRAARAGKTAAPATTSTAMIHHKAEGGVDRGEVLRAAAERLVERLGMGTEYRVMGITAGGGKGGEGETWPFVEMAGEVDKDT